jgi:hypothetical protein
LLVLESQSYKDTSPTGFPVKENYWHSGVSAKRRRLITSGNICGGLPTRRYGAGESFAIHCRDWPELSALPSPSNYAHFGAHACFRKNAFAVARPGGGCYELKSDCP